MFREVTYIATGGGAEIYVGMDVDTGQVMDVYATRDDAMKLAPDLAWVDGGNPLFVHAFAPGSAFLRLVHGPWVFPAS